MPSIQGDDSGLGFGLKGTSVTGIGVAGESGAGTAVDGFSKKGVGVAGASDGAEGVSGFAKVSDGVLGVSDSHDHSGVRGRNKKGSAGVTGEGTPGVFGTSSTSGGLGVAGQSSAGIGVLGQSDTGSGVDGESGQGNGVSGRSKRGSGVVGQTPAATGSGVFGSNTSKTGEDSGVFGPSAGVVGLSNVGFGVIGQAVDGLGKEGKDRTGIVAGVLGKCDGTGWGVRGDSPKGRAGVSGSSDVGDGVQGNTSSDASSGVHGVNQRRGDGVRGEGNFGVHGMQNTATLPGAGVRGETPVRGSAGVLGVAHDGFGVCGLSGSPNSTFSAFGEHAGVIGVSDISPGVIGQGIGSQPGLFAIGKPAVLGFGDIAALGTVSAIGAPAGSFIGDVNIAGTLKATSKLFHIDHPLHPADKYLNHASVESSEMKTMYDGVVILDAHGQARIELPDWFEALNTSVRYQLTSMGAASPGLHVATEVKSNRFEIAGGAAGGKVSWQVTGVRHDPFAQKEPLVVETDKPAEERGYFLHPEHHGHAKERGLAWAQKPELMSRVEHLRVSAKKQS